MTYQHFMFQIGRLTNTFGKTAYGEERVKLIWNELRDFDVNWFTDLVDKFIGESRQAPLLPEFRDAAIDERQRLYEIEKEINKKNAIQNYKEFSQEENKLLFEQTRQILKGEMAQLDFNHMIKSLKKIAAVGNPIICNKCEDTGLEEFFDGRFTNKRVCMCQVDSERQMHDFKGRRA